MFSHILILILKIRIHFIFHLCHVMFSNQPKAKRLSHTVKFKLFNFTCMALFIQKVTQSVGLGLRVTLTCSVNAVMQEVRNFQVDVLTFQFF